MLKLKTTVKQIQNMVLQRSYYSEEEIEHLHSMTKLFSLNKSHTIKFSFTSVLLSIANCFYSVA